jgi:hypothetical protein
VLPVWALKIKIFLGPEMATSKANAIQAQKSQKGEPLPMCQVMDLPPSKSLKVHKIENFFSSESEFCIISLLVLLKY